jgi:hypothetical protein
VFRPPGPWQSHSLLNVSASRKPAQSEWPGTPCDSDAWPLSRSFAVFEARRAIGQIVHSDFDCVSDRRLDNDLIVAYVRAANDIEAAIGDIRADLVAEARTRGVTWDKIGQALKIGDTGAQRRFGHGLAAERLAILREEARIVSITKRAGPDAGATPEDLEQFEGTTPAQRLDYIRAIVDGTRRDFEKLMGEMVSDSPVLDEMLRLLDAITERLPVLVTIGIDRGLWEAVTGWAGRPEDPDDSHYYAPVAYLSLALRLTLNAAFWIAGVPRQDESGDLQARSPDEILQHRSIYDLGPASACIEMAWRLFRRNDVLKALGSPQA